MLKLENVSKYYYSSSTVTCALRRINLEFSIGEFVSITGESGSGKTTLLNILSGFDSYEEGEIYFNGKQTSYFDSDDWEKYRKDEIAFVFQNYNLVDSYSVLENVLVTYIIEGYSYKEAKIKAKEKLELVGLGNDLHKKTSKLSGGQKQRLAIARALAKETNIIIADEPTGNLDEENGNAILELLKKLSADKLVIIVTHNLAQIEPYITRNIRLHDGGIVSDEIKIQKDDVKYVEKNKVDASIIKTVLNFSFLNVKGQPIKSLLLFLLIMLCTFSSFIFLINFKSNLDDNKTRELDSFFFKNFDDTRLLVKKDDSSYITSEDFNKIDNEDIISVEKYDYITDINYFRPTDYKYVVDGEYVDPKKDDTMIDTSYYILEDYSHFMRSSSSLTKDMLEEGRLPENGFEMVVYSNDSSILGTEELVMFHNEKKMGINVRYEYKVKIVGLLKEPTNQAYFSDDICRILDLTQYDLGIIFYYNARSGVFPLIKTIKFNSIVIDPDLGDYDISYSTNYVDSLKGTLKVEKNFYFSYGGNSHSIDCNYQDVPTLNVANGALGVSKEIFDLVYQYYTEKNQFVVFIDDYTNTDAVIEYLSENDYYAISCFKASVVGYDTEKVVNRYINLLVSVVSLIVINVVVVVLCYTILKIKKNDYVIFKLNGLSNKFCIRINYIEVIFYNILANLLLVIIANVINSTTSNLYIVDIFKYIKFYDYIIVLGIVTVSSVYIGRLFGEYLSKFTKVTSLREE